MATTSARTVPASFDRQPDSPTVAQRIAKKAITLWTVMPLCADLAQSRLARAAGAMLPARLRGFIDRPRAVHPSFIHGDDLGARLAREGASAELQLRLSSSYPGPGAWDPTRPRPDREACLTALRSVVGAAFIEHLGSLLQGIHEAGGAVGDLSYGDVGIFDGKPHLCGVGGRRRRSLRFLAQRERDRDRFNFLFGTQLLSEQVFRARIAALAARRADLFYAPVYYGRGYSVGAISSIEVGTGKWLFIRRHLPEVRGKRVLDLGTNNAMVPLEMLRAGARSVTAYEVDPVFADYARLNRSWFEFVDNRSYGLELVERPMRAVLDRDLAGYDIATSFCSLYYEPPEIMARITRALSRAVEYFVVQANENQEQHSGELARLASLDFLSRLLAENGFAKQRIVRRGYYNRPLMIGRADRKG
ncbi:MAG TPA: hypothetical protein VL742_14550 [Casimicrobiaceae bacterium]|nr:hypothetical protein [Casimicrobiaceae bacterium]